jgi:hypothetical protein
MKQESRNNLNKVTSYSNFYKLLQQIMSQEPVPILSQEEIYFNELAIGVIELVREKYVVLLN